MSLERPKKPKMLVVDDEPDNLDLLYRTFRRDFTVLRAESGVAALQVLAAEGEVAVIISDQRMPEMKGTEFLSKTVPQFPDTMRIILTGFTDVEDLVEAINSGQVYKYITKPWDPNELKQVVQRAAETYELLKLRTEELHRAQTQMALFNAIARSVQQHSNPQDCLQAIADAHTRIFSADACVLNLIAEPCLSAVSGSAASLDQDPLLQAAIAAGQIQAAPNLSSDAALAELPHYQAKGILAHLVVPIQFQSTLLGVLSLQWHHPQEITEEDLALMQLAAQQIGIVLACLQRQPALV
ncbi:MAG: response regulator [Elainella sp.]